MDDVQHMRELLDERTQAIRNEIDALRTLLDERYVTGTKALDAAFVAAEKAVTTALDSAEKAVAKAEASVDRHFESVNASREQLRDQAATFVTKAEQAAVNKGLTDRLARVEQAQEHADGRTTGISAARAAVYAGVGTAATVVMVGLAILNLNG